ncbi:hypothetical protein ABT352_33195 [Streptosporangium sp. NPDC000563]|uniref:hypothetical protein n=1 Tax=Streptosporangium sp. NPDC000563 TaxID=3154366 RepID=UPI003324E2A5
MSADTTALAALTNPPASDDLIEELADTVRSRLDHEHPEPGSGADWFCLNLVGYMGERMGNVLTRLRAAETERDQLRAEVKANRQRWYHDDQSRTLCVAGHDPETRQCAEGGGPVLSEVEYLTQLVEIWQGLTKKATEGEDKARAELTTAQVDAKKWASVEHLIERAIRKGYQLDPDDLTDALNPTP